MARSDNKRMKAFSKRLNEMRKTPSAAITKAEEATAPKLSSVDTPKQKINADLGNLSFKEAFRAARKNNPGEAFTWRGKSYSTALASENKAPVKRQGTSGASKTDTSSESAARQKYADIMAKNFAARANAPKPVAGSTAPRNVGVAPAAPAPARNIDRFNLDRVRAEMAKPEKRSPLFAGEDKLKAAQERAAAKQRGYAEGGSVKKYKKGGPVMESDRKPIDTRRAILGSDKEIVARGNRTPYEPIPKKGPDAPKRKPLGRAGAAGYKSGGSVMKKGADGIAKKGKTKGMMPKMACGGKGYAKGGSIDGIAKKGKTRCKGMK